MFNVAEGCDPSNTYDISRDSAIPRYLFLAQVLKYQVASGALG